MSKIVEKVFYNLFGEYVSEPFVTACIYFIAAILLLKSIIHTICRYRVNRLDDREKKLLALGAFYFMINKESVNKFTQPNVSLLYKKDVFKEMWGIYKREDAIEVLDYLSIAEGHTEICDSIYNVLILNGRKSVTKEDIFRMKGFENTLNRIAKRYNLDGVSEDERKDIITYDVNISLECFWAAYENLIELGYTNEELSKIKTLAAWDLMRTIMVARGSAKYNLGYISVNETWDYMNMAEERARKLYSNWREYMAAFLFGRAIAFHEDSIEHNDTIKFLIHNEKSVFNKYNFKEYI